MLKREDSKNSNVHHLQDALQTELDEAEMKESDLKKARSTDTQLALH